MKDKPGSLLCPDALLRLKFVHKCRMVNRHATTAQGRVHTQERPPVWSGSLSFWRMESTRLKTEASSRFWRSSHILEQSGLPLSKQNFGLKDVSNREIIWPPQASKAEKDLISSASLWGSVPCCEVGSGWKECEKNRRKRSQIPQTRFKRTTRKKSRQTREREATVFI